MLLASYAFYLIWGIHVSWRSGREFGVQFLCRGSVTPAPNSGATLGRHLRKFSLPWCF